MELHDHKPDRSARPRSAGELARALRSPESGLLGQGARFVLAGGTVMVVYLTTTSILANFMGVAFQAALAIGFCVGLMVHFTLQRMFVWAHEEFALALHHQAVRYLSVAAVQYGITAASTAVLPHALGISTEVVYLATVATVTATNFVVFRNGIFHPKPVVDAAMLASMIEGDGAAEAPSRGARAAAD